MITLADILASHAAWLAGDPTGQQAQLRGANLKGMDLRNVSLRNAKLLDADLRGADLRDVN